ncbi:DUF4249 family protein [Marivirga atlantica]|jgi:hypothetical protein|uniref:DUF4249 family protein n=1 Tax=Marivirga atlantica TaxID=1548457 RepID=A0A937AEQ6_9BACT|nr:DUF4249 family protein [Marivirga atlantica]MBL0765346.1 DUF4249 family protein [Marivirga atlantica]
MFTGCVEPYEFLIENGERSLVVEGFISNISFNKTLDFPSDGRFFTIKLSYTSDVINISGRSISGASVTLIDDQGNTWNYNELDNGNEVKYILNDSDFNAKSDRKYQLRIILPNDEIYESEWVSMPERDDRPIGEISFTEDEKLTYKYVANEEEIVSIQGINVQLNIAQNNSAQKAYFKYIYDPTWIFPSVTSGSIGGINSYLAQDAPQLCWAKNKLFLNDYTLLDDLKGGYKHKLFFIETLGNERIYLKLSVLIIQQQLNKKYFHYWQELKENAAAGTLFDKLPYNLSSNIYHVGGNKKVSGYFDVVREKATRWYFDKDQLSYNIENKLAENCIKYAGVDGPAQECYNCLYYTRGETVGEAPCWWNPQ